MSPGWHPPPGSRAQVAAWVLSACAALQAGCGGASGGDAPPAQAVAVASHSTPVPPAPSYEVSIATAAAERNRELRGCEELARPARGPCRTAAEQRFEAARAELADSRGDQP